MYTHASGGVAERSKAPVLKTVPIRIQQTTQTNITANTRPVARGCFSRLSGAMEFAKNCPEIVRNFSASYSGIRLRVGIPELGLNLDTEDVVRVSV